jgi:WhiB family redox-sensing transcriptional regulator
VTEPRPACRAEDPELFFPLPSEEEQIAQAKQVCARCPLTRTCLTYAVTHPVHGVWGGTTEGERQQLQRRHGLPVRVRWSAHAETAPTDDFTTTDDMEG